MNTLSGRSGSIDLTKCMATCAVLMIHCSANRYQLFTVGSLDWLTVLFWNGTCKWAVPVFLMCSGALMNDPQRELPLNRQHLLPPLLFLFCHRSVPGPASHPADHPVGIKTGAALPAAAVAFLRQRTALPAILFALPFDRPLSAALYPLPRICQRRPGASGLVPPPKARRAPASLPASLPGGIRSPVLFYLATQRRREKSQYHPSGRLFPCCYPHGRGSLPDRSDPGGGPLSPLLYFLSLPRLFLRLPHPPLLPAGYQRALLGGPPASVGNAAPGRPPSGAESGRLLGTAEDPPCQPLADLTSQAPTLSV